VTEESSNGAEGSALHQRNKLHFKIYSKRKHVLLNWNNISQYSCFYSIFLINAAFKDFSQNIKKKILPVHHHILLLFSVNILITGEKYLLSNKLLHL